MTVRPWLPALYLALIPLAPAARCAAQPADPPRRTVTEGVPGVSIFTPDRWGIVGVTIVNPGDRPAEVLSSHYFGSESELQFARQLWVPAKAKRSSWYPVLPPARLGRGLGLPVGSLLIDRTEGREAVLKEPGGAVFHEGLLPSQPTNDPVTGLIADADDRQAALLVQVARAARNLSPRVARLGGDGLPPCLESLDGLDQLVIASDRPASDPAGLRAVRQWLHAGGRLWVCLDRVSPATVSLLLGEDFPGTAVGRVGLTRWQFRKERLIADPDDDAFDAPGPPPAGDATEALSGAVGDFEPPVPMVRVLIPGVRPVYSLDGWPASFWRRSGRGIVLFTTVGPRAWLAPRPKADRTQIPADSPVAGVVENQALRDLAFSFLRPREGPPLEADAFGPLLSGQVGHRVIGRGAVAAVLGLFCGGLAAAGCWLGRRGGLAHLGWAGPAAALAAALLLFALGHQARSQVPLTVGVAQLVEVTPGAGDAPVTGLLALYNPGGPVAPLGAERGGVFLPAPEGQEGTTRRMVWTDLDHWHWENLTLAPGLHLLPFQAAAEIDQPLAARVTFGPEGVIGIAALGPLRDPGDALLALPSRRNLAVRFTGADGAFVAGPDDQLAPGQFLASGVLSDEQRHRQEVYRQLLDRRTGPRYPARPTFLTWAAPLDLGFALPAEARRTGAALAAIPLTTERPAPGTRVTIPGPFLPYQGVGRDGFSLLYDPKNNEWVAARRTAARTLLRFQIPPELLPLRVERATLEVDVNAPGRPLEVLAGEGATALATRHGPVGRLRFTIDRADVLQPDAEGGVYLGLAVGDPTGRPGATAPADEWQVNELQLELTGRVPED